MTGRPTRLYCQQPLPLSTITSGFKQIRWLLDKFHVARMPGIEIWLADIINSITIFEDLFASDIHLSSKYNTIPIKRSYLLVALVENSRGCTKISVISIFLSGNVMRKTNQCDLIFGISNTGYS